MKNNNDLELDIQLDDEINLSELVTPLIKHKIKVIIITAVFGIFSVWYSLSLPNIYRSTATLAEASNDQAGIAPQGGLASLAGFAGVDLGTREAKDQIALELLASLSFYSKIFDDDEWVRINLFAAERWNPDTNEILYNEKIYSTSQFKWTRKESFPYKIVPSNQESFLALMKNTSISKDQKTGMIKLSFEHVSPFFAKELLDKIIYEINSTLRDRDKYEAQRAINYLNTQISKTSLIEVKQALSALLQNETKKLMLTESREDYHYTIVDPPFVPEVKNSPKRAIICIIITIIGFALSFLLSIFIEKKKDNKLS